MRGFEARRFTDRNHLLLTGEYRWRPSRHVDMAAFFDAGRVAAHPRELGLAKLETDWGLGSRFHSDSMVLLRAEIAKSREGWEVVLAEGKLF